MKNFFGAETKQEQGWLIEQLQIAYKNNYEVVSDHNSQVLFQALRLMMLPELIKEEFDEAIRKNVGRERTARPSNYETEVAKILKMDEKEKNELKAILYEKEGCDDSGSKRRTCDGDVEGFAIYSKSFASTTISGIGKHYVAKERLFHAILGQENAKRKEGNKIHYYGKEAFEIRYNIWMGLIFNNIPGFTTPLLVFFLDYRENWEDIAGIVKFLKNQKKYIPISYSCNLL